MSCIKGLFLGLCERAAKGLNAKIPCKWLIYRGINEVCTLLFVARPGFEPRQTEPKSVVLPLYYRAILHLRVQR